MASVKLLLDSNKIFHRDFAGTKPGYDALQVDAFLDVIIKDYDSFAKYQEEVEQEEKDLNSKVSMLTEELSKAEAENAQLKSKLQDIDGNQDAAFSNINYLQRIAKLEKALSKAGINPNTIE